MSSREVLRSVLLGTLMFACVGCGSKQPATTPKSDAKAGEGPVLAPPQKSSAATTPAGDHTALPTESDPTGTANASETPNSSDDETVNTAKIKANLASLSIEDRALAEKQKICPVSGGPLGAMGPPKKISVAGHDVFICCGGCEKPLHDEPAKYLEKIGLSSAK